MIVSNILSKIRITSKVEKSLIPERQEIKKIPDSYNIKKEDIVFETSDNLKLKGWWIKGSKDTTIILSHSFGANRTGWEGTDVKGNYHKIDLLPSLKVLADYGYNILAFDHRACGESEGELTYFGKNEALDIVAAVKWIKNNNKKLNKFSIIGFSSGANATLRAIEILEKEQKGIQISGVVVNLYWYEKMIKKSMNFFTNIPVFVIPAIKRAMIDVVGFDPVKEINPANILSKIKSPILIVNSEFDEIANISTIKNIYKKRPINTDLFILKNKKRFYSYHVIEKKSQKIINFINKSFEKKDNKRVDILKNENTAILSIEFQKSWTDKGFFNRLIKKELKKNNVVENAVKLLNNARKNNIKVFQAPLFIDKKDKNYKKTPLPARLFKQLTVGTWKSEFTDDIYKETDIVATGRYGFDATKGSNLESLLKKNNIKYVFVCGFTTDHCVKETMDTLIENGYKCVMIPDCTAAISDKIQKRIEREFETIVSSELIKIINK